MRTACLHRRAAAAAEAAVAGGRGGGGGSSTPHWWRAAGRVDLTLTLMREFSVGDEYPINPYFLPRQKRLSSLATRVGLSHL